MVFEKHNFRSRGQCPAIWELHFWVWGGVNGMCNMFEVNLCSQITEIILLQSVPARANWLLARMHYNRKQILITLTKCPLLCLRPQSA